MLSFKVPDNEIARLKALFDFHILDTEQEETYDCITRLAAHIMGTEMAVLSFTDKHRQWFKAKIGVAEETAPRELTFCTHTILDPDSPLIVTDVFSDERFADNPAVIGEPKIRFYCGYPLSTSNKETIGTLCVFSGVPGEHPSQAKLDAMQDLAKLVMNELELRKFVFEVQKQMEALRQYQVDESESKTIVNLYKQLSLDCDAALLRMKSKKNLK